MLSLGAPAPASVPLAVSVAEPAAVIGPSQRPARHPGQLEETEREVRRDIFNLPPTKILERGPYIREWDEEGEDFAMLCDAVRERGEIDTPIWVRSEGGAGRRVFILVAGKGRLKAALKNRLSAVPVRDLGPLTDKEALERQAQENEHRNEMSLGNKANAFYVLESFGHSTATIGKLYGKDRSYISILGRIGEAIAGMKPAEQAALRRTGAFQYREAQAIAGLPDIGARQAALRAVLRTPSRSAELRDQGADAEALGHERAPRGREARTTRPDEREAFHARATRNGRSFRMRWDLSALQAEPQQLAAGFAAAVQQEAAEMLAALQRIEDTASSRDAASVREARRVLEALRAVKGS
jgi:ParB-like chromosome segregation protein Spo0J